MLCCAERAHIEGGAAGGEESAGAIVLSRDGSVRTTDKDGIILASFVGQERLRQTSKEAQATVDSVIAPS
jgi:phosphoglucomutase